MQAFEYSTENARQLSKSDATKKNNEYFSKKVCAYLCLCVYSVDIAIIYNIYICQVVDRDR